MMSHVLVSDLTCGHLLVMQVPVPNSRARFNTLSFAKQYSLGNPVAAAYFTVAAPGYE